jgi:hypothetical protein
MKPALVCVQSLFWYSQKVPATLQYCANIAKLPDVHARALIAADESYFESSRRPFPSRVHGSCLLLPRRVLKS